MLATVQSQEAAPRRALVVARAGLAVSVVAQVGVLAVGNETGGGLGLGLFLLALAGFATMLIGQHRQPVVGARILACIIAGLLIVAVVIAPRQSLDTRSYAMYGRMVSHYHVSPYTHQPSDFPSDPIAKRVSRFWQNVPSVYGPTFTVLSAAGMWVAGSSPLFARLFFQGLAALAVALALLLIYRKTGDIAAVACLGLNPVVIVSVVNGGHNDALVGLAVLGAVVLALDERWALAGFVLALGAMVKIVALLSLAGLVLWAWRRRGLRTASTAAAVGAGSVLVGYALCGGRAVLAPLRIARLEVSGGSIWNLPRHNMMADLMEDGLRGKAAGLIARGRIAEISLLVVIALLLVVVLPRLRDPTPTLAAGGAVLAYLLAGAYVLPWYAFIVLPALSLHWKSRLNLLVTALAALLVAAYGPRPTVATSSVYRALIAFTTDVLPAFELAAIALVITWAALEARRHWATPNRH